MYCSHAANTGGTGSSLAKSRETRSSCFFSLQAIFGTDRNVQLRIYALYWIICNNTIICDALQHSACWNCITGRTRSWATMHFGMCWATKVPSGAAFRFGNRDSLVTLIVMSSGYKFSPEATDLAHSKNICQQMRSNRNEKRR